jgi:glycerol-3-phosphate dehydrogenase
VRTDPRQLYGEAFDVVVVGAGLQGAAIAREAAARGLRALLVDAEDVAAGTSSCGSGWIQDGVPALCRPGRGSWSAALRERERLLRTAPHLVRPLPILTPLFDDGAAPAWRLQLGAWLYRIAARR